MFKPMLATPIDFNKINPDKQYMISPKLDGVRCLVNNSGVFTRSMKLIPNKYISEYLLKWFIKIQVNDRVWIDGELIVGNPTDLMCYRNTTSVVMSKNKTNNDWKFFIFDMAVFPYDEDVLSRNTNIINYLKHNNIAKDDKVEVLNQHSCSGREVQSACKRYLDCGYEGAMVKPADVPYKFGRATPKSMELMKYKAWEDDEATVIGYVQKEKNTNEAKINELGNTERSSHKSGMIVVDELGSLVVNYKGKQFSIGSGFTEEERKKLWLTRDKLIGKLVKFKYMPYGAYEKPREPIYLGFRSKLDK